MALLFLGSAFSGIRLNLKKTFFVWTIALGKILTIDNLRKKHHSDELVLYV